MTSKDFKPYQAKSHAALEKLAVKHFNAWIRWRDSQEIKEGFVCISCRHLKPQTQMTAGHFYSAGHYPVLRFDEDNVHGQCDRCNRHLSGNLNEYRKRLEVKIGKGRLEILDQKSSARGYRIDRWTLIELIITYKNKLKTHVKKTHVLPGTADHNGGTGPIQPKRSKLFQSSSGGKPTG